VPSRAAPSAPMAEITVRGAATPAMPGEALVDTQGRVAGILSGARGSERSFLPMPLVVGVSDELESAGAVRHGWLGITDSTPLGSTGAQVLWVDPQGAVAHALRAGDVIVRVDGWRVRSAADLRSMLYLMAPGARVSVEAQRGSQLVRTVVKLAPSP
ncbi:MAG: S1C family serine protease, partial [Acidimicrobiales bacterium]